MCQCKDMWMRNKVTNSLNWIIGLIIKRQTRQTTKYQNQNLDYKLKISQILSINMQPTKLSRIHKN